MYHEATTILCIILFAPLIGALIAGIFGKHIGKQGAHWVTIMLVGLSFFLSVWYTFLFLTGKLPVYNHNLFNWAVVDHIQFGIGFMVDRLTVFMLNVVTFVSLLVHIYSIGYMDDDPGYQRFFSYISAFTFAMLSLVLANNFLLLFFGWEGVGLVSYLLIGFWFKRESANYAALKAFLANRVGDLGMMLGIAAVLMYFGTINYAPVFSAMPAFAAKHQVLGLGLGLHWSAVTVMCILLFIGAMGKSAQVPLHIWLEGSMEGPTPISALIHAATMVTAGVFMVARLSPMFEFSSTALSFVMVIGATTAFFMGVLGVVQFDVKRVIAYSTLSQLGYMIAAQGASAYPLGMFHLMTHAAFKALLFLSAGSVIVALHHEQDMRKMGGLVKKLPITYICMLIGGCALAAIPPFSGFFSKDLIIEAVGLSKAAGHTYSWYCLVGGAFLTALYTFRMIFMVFHGKPRMSAEAFDHVKEPSLTILVPLILLAIPATLAGYYFFEPALNGFFGYSVFILPIHNVVAQLQATYHSPWQLVIHAFHSYAFYYALAGLVVAWVGYIGMPSLPGKLSKSCQWFYQFLIKKYFVDDAFDAFFGRGSYYLGRFLWRTGDQTIIDEGCVNGSAKTIGRFAAWARQLQTGYLFHYAFAMVIGLGLCFVWVLWIH